jgi:hypothetical protein
MPMPLEDALKQYFDAESLIDNRQYELRVKVIDRKRSFFHPFAAPGLSVLVILHTSEIPFQEMAGHINRHFVSGQIKGAQSRCCWFICSDRGGIYLHESIETKENRKYLGMKNRFIVLNSGNGSVSFGPGHVRNRPVSERMRLLLEQYRLIPASVWRKKMFSLLDFCLETAGR